MKTDDLIAALSTGLDPVPRRAVSSRLALGLGLGIVVSAALMWAWLGLRPDLMPAMMTGSFWMKFFYAFSFAVFGFALADRLARPAGEGGVWGWLILLPLGLIAALAAYRLAAAGHDQRMPLMMGSSARVCARNIVVLSLPVFVAVFLSLRALAPTRLTLAGAAGGLLAGATGTVVYAFHCTETAAPFVAIWYTLGIALMGVLGAALGRLLLRWR